MVGERLLVDRVPVAEDAAWSRVLLLAFARHGFSGLTLLAGLDGDELAAFLDSCHGGSEPAAVAPPADRQRRLRRRRSRRRRSASPPSGGCRRWRAPQELAAGREDFAAVAAQVGPRRRLASARLVAALTRAAAGARLEPPRLATVNAGDREFLHGLATALGTLRLARALGDRRRPASRTSASPACSTTSAGWRRRPSPARPPCSAHPVLGAAQLAATPGVPPVAILVAFEHHLRFDLEPSYPRLSEPRRPSAAAQLVAVADTWDTLRGRGRLPPAEAAHLLRRRAGTFLNPALVEVFASSSAPSG